jgi:pimeloyl-ACP methyl ester carboxylesterase
MIPKPAKVVHVGHSFGSSITSGFAGAAPGLSDGVVLTGYSTNGSWGLNFAIASGFHLASETLPSKFGHLDKGFLTWPDELANQFLFFHYPQFDPKVLAGSERTKAPFSVGELLNVNGGPAPAWNGPLLVRLNSGDLSAFADSAVDHIRRVRQDPVRLRLLRHLGAGEVVLSEGQGTIVSGHQYRLSR